MAIWRRPKLTARGDPAHDHVVAGIVARLLELPRQSVVLAEDETHLNLLPHVRASWTLRGARPEVLTPGTNRKVTVLGTIEMTTGAWVYRLGRRCAADFIALLQMLAEAFPQAPVIVVICDNDSIHHARTVTAYLKQQPRLELLYGARYSPHDNPAERIWAALKNYVANTAVTWPARLRQIHSFFATAHRTRCWPPPRPGPVPGSPRLRAELLECRLVPSAARAPSGRSTASLPPRKAPGYPSIRSASSADRASSATVAAATTASWLCLTNTS